MLREVRYHLGTPGFRTRQITLVTTLLDAEVYCVADLAELYRLRWQVETSLAHLKTTMQMDVLHCKTGTTRAEGTDRLGHRLQPGPYGHVPISHAPTPRRGADQLSGCSAMARRAEHRDPIRSVGRQPHPTASSGAARQETAAQEFPLDDQVPARTASAVGTAKVQRLT